MKSGFAFAGLLTVLFLALACTRHVEVEQEMPADLIPRDSMVDILVDLQIMESILSKQQRQNRSKVNQSKYYYFKSVMEKHDITREQFERSFDYYQYNLKILDEIYADAITKITKMETNVSMD